MAELTTIPTRRDGRDGYRRRRAERHRKRGLVEGDQGRQERHRAITRFDPSKYATQLAGEVEDFDADDYIEKRLRCRRTAGRTWRSRPRRWPWTTPSTTRREQDEWSQSVITASRLGRERVRPEGDPGAVEPGPRLRGRLPVDRLVLRRDDRADLDPAQPEGAVRRRRCPRAPAAWRRSSTRGGRSAAGSRRS